MSFPRLAGRFLISSGICLSTSRQGGEGILNSLTKEVGSFIQPVDRSRLRTSRFTRGVGPSLRTPAERIRSFGPMLPASGPFLVGASEEGVASGFGRKGQGEELSTFQVCDRTNSWPCLLAIHRGDGRIVSPKRVPLPVCVGNHPENA